MYIIQTNRNTVDFQSCMYEIKSQTWEEFKDYILSNEQFTAKVITTTFSDYPAKTKRDNIKVIKALINDDFHLEVIFEDNQISSYMKVDNEFFKSK